MKTRDCYNSNRYLFTWCFFSLYWVSKFARVALTSLDFYLNKFFSIKHKYEYKLVIINS